ncbi:MAG TPA: DUF4142 domain-containing protein [Gemmatimonadales bacterium]|jgi:putative membrane protein
MMIRMLVLLGTVMIPAVPKASARVPSDATILGTLAASDANEIEEAKLGSSKAKALEVKDYADVLVRDTERLRQEAVVLATRLAITPVVDTSGAASHRDLMTKLNALAGVAFDHAFVQAMVDAHKAALAKLSGSFLPAASNPQLKAYIRKLIPTVRDHETMGERWLSTHK